MPKFNVEQTVIVAELQQLLAEFVRELDLNDSLNAADFYTEDGKFVVGSQTYTGRAAIKKFYADRNERVRTELKSGARTLRHTFLNIAISIRDNDHATVHFTNVNYSGEGKPPVVGLSGPAMVADCRMEFRREADDQWLIAEFVPEPVFIGNDEFTNNFLLKS